MMTFTQEDLDRLCRESYVRGTEVGYASAKVHHDDAHKEGYAKGHGDGFKEGYEEGHGAGFKEGYEEGLTTCEENYDSGYKDGFDEGRSNLGDIA